MAGFGQNDEIVLPAIKPFGANDEAVSRLGRGGLTPPATDARPGFFETVGSDLAKVPSNLWNTIRHPFDSSDLGQAVNFDKSISPADRAKAGTDATNRSRGFPLAGTAPLVTPAARETEPGMGETAGHLVSPYIADAAMGAIGEGIESPAVRGFVGGAVRAAPLAVRNAIPYAGGAALMNRFMPGPVANIADAAAVATAIPPIIRAGRAGAVGKEAFGPAAKAIFPASPQPRALIESPDDASYVRGSNAKFGEQPLLEPGARTAPPAPDASFVRGAPAMTQPPNPGRALPAPARVIQMPPAPDASYVKGFPAEYPEILSGPLTPPEAAATPVAPPPVQPRTFANGGIKNNTRRR